MPLLGAHVSVAGGLSRAVERAVVQRCDAMQIFTKNASQWRGRPLAPEEAVGFRAAVKASGVAPVVSHASYLINLAAEGSSLRRQSMLAMADEIDRAEALGLLGVVLHPGSYTDGHEASGLDLIGEALVALLDRQPEGRTMVLLEQTAGQGTSLGTTFEQLASIITKTNCHRRIGVCLDTCHLLAAGYDLCTSEGYERAFEQFGRLIGLERLRLFHLNDSKKPLGSHVDRHEHIGRGYLGLSVFRRLLNDPRFAHLPMLLETPKESDGRPTGPVVADRFDRRNLRVLRGLVKKSGRAGDAGGAGRASEPHGSGD